MRATSKPPPARKPAAILAATVLAAGLAGASSGCIGPPETPPDICYSLPCPQDLRRVTRVTMIELDYDGDCPEVRRRLSEAIARAVQDRCLFRLRLVAADDPALAGLPVDAERSKTIRDLAIVRRQLGGDALLVGSVRRYEPFPRMQVGLYLALLDLKRGKCLWSLQHTWDASDRDIEWRLRRFYDQHVRDDFGPLDWRIATISPRAFERFVAFEAAGTLQITPPETAQTARFDRKPEKL